MTYSFPVSSLIQWFKTHKRDLPWRENMSPYSVWVSEVMLQQTQAITVIPYFNRWMKRFPNPKALADASEQEVIKEWEGLGYYSRARNLHQGAKLLVEAYRGELPNTREELSKIKGIGEYTLGAILSFAFKKKAAAVDGNTLRVLSRFFAIEEDISKGITQKKFQKLAFDILPDKEPEVLVEALIELGATICQKKPRCLLCPLQKDCQSRREGREESFPIKEKKMKKVTLIRHPLLFIWQDNLLVRRCTEGEIMCGLYEFPYFEGETLPSKIEKYIQDTYFFKAAFKKVLPNEKHSFTVHQVTLFPQVFTLKGYEKLPKDYVFEKIEKLTLLPFSSGHRKVLLSFIKIEQ